MKIVFLSDTHSLHSKLKVPDGDVLVHAGDFTGHGSGRDVAEFNAWLGTLPHKHKLVTPGNHDTICERDYNHAKELLFNAQLLVDELVEIDRVRFYLSPWSPRFGRWSFMRERGEDMRSVWSKIPNQVDVLVTHTPPKGTLDFVPRFNPYSGVVEQDSVGCVDLYNKVMLDIKPKIHAFGHIHEGYGQVVDRGITFVNAASCDAGYRPVNPPIVVELA